MQSKIIFSDNGQDKAITGEILDEDNLFLKLLSRGLEYRISKARIVCVRQSEDDENGSK